MANTVFEKVKAAGKTTEEAKKRTTPIQDLASGQGQLIPTDQVSATLLGAKPDQVKMVGGAPQIRNAIQKNMEPGQTDLATAQRTAQPRRGQTEEEKAATEQQQRLAGLGSLDNRVQQLVNQRLDLQNKQLAVDIDESKFPGTLTEEQKPRVKELALKVAEGTATADETAELNRALGRDINSALSAEEVGLWLKSPEQLAGEQAAREVQDDVKLSDIPSTDLGYASYTELAQDLGLDPAAMEAMNLNQLIEAVQKKQRSDYSSANRWREVLNDPSSSTNDRAEAARILREMGATGVRESSDAMEKLSADIAASNTVQFGGEEYTVEELLSDETVADIAKAYFQNPDAAERIKKENPGLAAFFDQHKEVLEEASKNIKTEVSDLDTILQKRRGVRDELVSIFGEEGYKNMFPQGDTITTEELQTPRYIQDKQKFSGTNLVELGQMAGDLYKLNPEFSNRINAMSYDEIKALGIDTKAGRDNFMAFAKLQNLLNQDLSKVNPDDVISSIYGNPDTLQQNLNSAKAMTGWTDSMLDANHDGKLDDPQAILARLKGQYSGQDLVGGFKSNNPANLPQTLGQIVSRYANPNTADGALFQAYSDGSLSTQEVSDIGNKFRATQDLGALKSLSSKDNRFSTAWTIASNQNADQKLAAMGKQYNTASFQAASNTAVNAQNVAGLKDMLNAMDQLIGNSNAYSSEAVGIWKSQRSALAQRVAAYDAEVAAAAAAEAARQRALLDKIKSRTSGDERKTF